MTPPATRAEERRELDAKTPGERIAELDGVRSPPADLLRFWLNEFPLDDLLVFRTADVRALLAEVEAARAWRDAVALVKRVGKSPLRTEGAVQQAMSAERAARARYDAARRLAQDTPDARA